MSESPFATLSRIIAEPSNLYDDLLIIADSGMKLDTRTREIIKQGAIALEAAERALITTNMALIESQQQRIALNERLIDLQKTDALRYAVSSMAPAWLCTVTFKE